jgi:FAD-dependent urate hydroxylase
VVDSVSITDDNKCEVSLSNGIAVFAEHLLLATGYSPNIENLQIIDTKIIKELSILNGHPVLDEHFESSSKGLFLLAHGRQNRVGLFWAS